MNELSTLTGSSTLGELRVAYGDNGSYEEEGSVAKCKVFITACRLLLSRLPSRSSRGGVSGGGDEIELNVNLVKGELEGAQRWLRAQVAGAGTAGGSRALHPDLDFKG